MRFVGSYSQVYYDNLHHRLSADFQNRYFFHRSIAITTNETTVYDFITPNKTCERHLETRSANVWNLVRSNQSLFK